MPTLNNQALEQLFINARSYNGFTDEPLSQDIYQKIYDLMKWGATAFNCQPARLVFVVSPQGKERLKKSLIEGNIAKSMAAPATVIIASDSKFYEHLPRAFTAFDAKPIFADNPELAKTSAMRNSSLQGAYLMLAARALGLSCGPMSGFDNQVLDKEFFPDGRFQSNFICNLGYGDINQVYPRNERFEFAEVCKIV